MSLKEIWWYLVAINFLLSGVQMYWCRYLYFTTGGEKIYINQVKKPNKNQRVGGVYKTPMYKMYKEKEIVSIESDS